MLLPRRVVAGEGGGGGGGADGAPPAPRCVCVWSSVCIWSNSNCKQASSDMPSQWSWSGIMGPPPAGGSSSARSTGSGAEPGVTVHEQSNTQQAARTLDSKRAAAVDVFARNWHVSHPRVGAYLIDRRHAGCAVSLCQWRLVNRLGGLWAITGRAPRTAYSLWFHSAAAWRCAGRWNR